jgi:hypothetical protein
MTIMAGVTKRELTLVEACELMAVSYRQSKRMWGGIRPQGTRAWCIGCGASPARRKPSHASAAF